MHKGYGKYDEIFAACASSRSLLGGGAGDDYNRK